MVCFCMQILFIVRHPVNNIWIFKLESLFTANHMFSYDFTKFPYCSTEGFRIYEKKCPLFQKKARKWHNQKLGGVYSQLQVAKERQKN